MHGQNHIKFEKRCIFYRSVYFSATVQKFTELIVIITYCRYESSIAPLLAFIAFMHSSSLYHHQVVFIVVNPVSYN